MSAAQPGLLERSAPPVWGELGLGAVRDGLLLKTAVRMAAAGVRSLMVWSFRGLTAGLHSPVA